VCEKSMSVGNRRGLTPRVVYVLQHGYSRRDFAADLIAGVTVGLVALPLAMAFGIASGTTPEASIYTAIVGGFIVSALGGSNIQIGGPTGAFVVVVAAIIAQHGLSGLAMVTMMAGVILLLLAIHRPWYRGEVHAASHCDWVHERHRSPDRFNANQRLPRVGDGGGPERVRTAHLRVLAAPATADAVAISVACVSLFVIVVTPRLIKRIPGQIVALLVGTAAVALLDLQVDTIGSQFGGIPRTLPHLQIRRAHRSRKHSPECQCCAAARRRSTATAWPDSRHQRQHQRLLRVESVFCLIEYDRCG
jgi:sulfate permease, SulP family